MTILKKDSAKSKRNTTKNTKRSNSKNALKQKELELQFCELANQQLGVGYISYQYETKKFLIASTISEDIKNILSVNEITPEILINEALPDNKNFVLELFKQPKNPKKKLSGELKFTSKNKEQKELYIFECTGTYVNISTPDASIFITMKDVTKENKQIRDLQRNLEKAQNSDQIKTNFLLNISHNIRTPMNSILGFSELLSIADPGTERRKEYIQVIKKQSKSLLQLIDDVAEIAKFENGTISISKSRVNINLLINEIIKDLENLRTNSRKEHVHINFQVPSEKGHEIYTDAGRLHQVFINLANNALKNTTEGSIKLGYREPVDNRIEFFIQDTSPGLNKDELKILFDQFATVQEQDEHRYSDENGLSLGIAKLIVKLLGGRISAESEPGKGLTISFSIPYEKVPEHKPTSIDEDNYTSQFKWSDKVVLIVEDEDVNALFLEAMFQGTDVQTIFAKNGNQAVELCSSINKIDLILMDIRMPVMNGILATKEIRKFNHNIPIIAQTALSHIEDRENCLLAGCNDFVTKPIEVEPLLNMLNDYLCS